MCSPKRADSLSYEVAGVSFDDQPDEQRSEEHTSELQSRQYLVCRLLLDTPYYMIYTLSLHDALPISFGFFGGHGKPHGLEYMVTEGEAEGCSSILVEQQQQNVFTKTGGFSIVRGGRSEF